MNELPKFLWFAAVFVIFRWLLDAPAWGATLGAWMILSNIENNRA